MVNLKLSVILIILLIGGLLLFSNGNQHTFNQGEYCSSMLSSISKVDYVNYDNDLKQASWLIDFTVTPHGGQCVRTTIPQTEFVDEQENVKGQDSVELKIEQLSSFCEYDVNHDTSKTPLYKAVPYYETKWYGIWVSDAEIEKDLNSFDIANNCNRFAFSGPCERTYDWGVLGHNCLFTCIKFNKAADLGMVKTPRYTFATKFTLGDQPPVVLGTSTLESEAGTMDGGMISGSIGDVGFIRWKGNVHSGDTCDSLGHRYYGVYPTTTSKWEIKQDVGNAKYSYYYNKYKDLYSKIASIVNTASLIGTEGIIERTKSEMGGIDREVQYLNNAVDTVLRLPSTCLEYGYIDLNTLLEDRDDRQHSTFKISSLKELYYPEFTLKLDAEWVGIYEPHGIPRITNCPDYTGAEFSSGTMSLDIKNIAEEYGYFAGRMVCPTATTTTPDTIQVAPGDTRNMRFDFNLGHMVTDFEETCTVLVYDINDPSQSDRCTPTISTTAIERCITGEERCLGLYERQSCSNNQWFTQERCEFGCEPYVEYGLSKARCKSSIVPIRCGNKVCEPQYGENIVTCPIDCLSSDRCNYGCADWDFQCKFNEMTCKMQASIVGLALYLGLFAVIILLFYLFVKFYVIKKLLKKII